MKLIKMRRPSSFTTLWDQQYGVSIGEAEILRINAIFHSESEHIPTIQRSKRYFMVFRLKLEIRVRNNPSLVCRIYLV